MMWRAERGGAAPLSLFFMSGYFPYGGGRARGESSRVFYALPVLSEPLDGARGERRIYMRASEGYAGCEGAVV